MSKAAEGEGAGVGTVLMGRMGEKVVVLATSHGGKVKESAQVKIKINSGKIWRWVLSTLSILICLFFFFLRRN